MKFFFKIFFILIFLASTSCQNQIVEGGNPVTRPVKGKLITQTPCSADTAVSTDAAGATVAAVLDTSDCSFNFDLEAGKLWGLSFEEAGATIANTVFVPTVKAPDPDFYFLTEKSEALDFGTITIVGYEATPENQPD